MAITSAILIGSPTAGTFAQDEEGTHKQHRFSDWLSALSSEQRAKLRATHEQALKTPEIRAANERRKKADAEYRRLLHQEMERIDPSLKQTLEKLAQLKKAIEPQAP